MSFDHKAYVFDYEWFYLTLKPTLEQSLFTNDPAPLKQFILDNLSLLKDPHEGQPLTIGWEYMLEAKDVQEYGKRALTLFYNPAQDLGLSRHWEKVQSLLLDQPSCPDSPLLGDTVGNEQCCFDPGKMGSYFKSPQQVVDIFTFVNQLIKEQPTYQIELAPFIDLLSLAIQQQQGLYITF